MVDLARDGMIDLNVPTTASTWSCGVEEYLADVDHELLYDPAWTGIDDHTTDHQYEFGRMDYEGMLAVLPTQRHFTGTPHPLAPRSPRYRVLREPLD